jgi:hypothetical protein
MLERHQLQPIVERVADAARERGVEPAVLIHGSAGWSHYLLRDGFGAIAGTGAVDEADAYVCVVSRGDARELAAELGLVPPPIDGGGVVVMGQSRAGDVVGGGEPELDAIRDRLTQILLTDS